MQVTYFADEDIQFVSGDSSSSAIVKNPQTPLPYASEDCLEPYYMASQPLSIPRHSAVRSPQTIPIRSIPSDYIAHQPPVASSAPEMWNSAPSTNSDGDSFSYQGSPAPGHAWVTSGDSPGSSAPSPRSWSPSAHHQEYNFGPSSWMSSDQKAPSSFDINICMSSHDNKHLHPELSDESTGYAMHQRSANVEYEDDKEAKEWARYNDALAPKTDYPPYGHPVEDQPAVGVDGPVCYAKLIRQALLSTPRHAMQLKEIYQWFKDNTEKGNTDKEIENKGWTNSVRHNLSMNEAFVRKARPPIAGEVQTSQNRKIIWEWCLEDFAVTGDNLLSTTRYRGNKNKNQRPKTRCPTRSNPGRKGGMCAGRSRMASKRMAQQGLLAQERQGIGLGQYSHVYPELDRHHYDPSQQLHTYPSNGNLYSGSAHGPPASYAYDLHQQAAYNPVHMNSIYQPIPLPSTTPALPEQSGSVYWHDQAASGTYQA